jgi:putative ABC transport system permease protein
MMQWIKIGFRNLVKNRRRSLATLIAIAIGFCAVGLFRGYTAATYDGLRRSAIRGEGLGHLTIYRQGYLQNGRRDTKKYLLSLSEIKKIIKIAKADPHVRLATPQLHIAGLVSNGRTSHIFLAKGVVPADFRAITGGMSTRRGLMGADLSSDIPYGVLLARDLAGQLDLPPKSDGVIMATTLDGQMNALDIRVRGTYDTGTAATNDKYMLLPYRYAQSLYDTKSADCIVVLLDNWQATTATRHLLAGQLTAAGLHCDIRTWEQLSIFYQKVKRMFDMIFLFIFLIVFIIVIMSTINTMGMSVMERTREIGTLRALGLKRRGVCLLFAIEGAILGLLGCLAGVVLNSALWAAIKIAAPSYIPPGVSTPVPLTVELLPSHMLTLALFLTLLCMAAAIWPARRAARLSMVEALGHV